MFRGGATLTRAKSGRISFLDVLSAVPPFSEGLLAVYNNFIFSKLQDMTKMILNL